MIKLSIIVPCYNCEKFISKTVQSIVINCETSETEIILINDGSKDNTLAVLNKLKKQYDNVVVIDKINEGVSATRNKGIEIAKGEYIGFVDSDDIIINNMFKNLLSTAYENNSDIVCCSFYEEKNGIRYKSKYQYNNVQYNKTEALKRFLINKTSIAVWDKIYRKKIIEKIKFNLNLAVGEDTLFCFESINSIETNFYECDVIGYVYLQRDGSAVHTVNDNIKGVSEVSNYVKVDNNLQEEFDYFISYSMMRCINTLSYLKSKGTINKIKIIIRDVYDKNKLKILIKSKYSPVSLKIESLILLVFGIEFHLFIFGFYDCIKKIKNKGDKIC